MTYLNRALKDFEKVYGCKFIPNCIIDDCIHNVDTDFTCLIPPFAICSDRKFSESPLCISFISPWILYLNQSKTMKSIYFALK